MRHTPSKGTNEELRGEDNTKSKDIDVKKITLVSYDNANVRRNVKEIQLTTSKLRIYWHTDKR